jgi:hypothetical protein
MVAGGGSRESKESDCLTRLTGNSATPSGAKSTSISLAPDSAGVMLLHRAATDSNVAYSEYMAEVGNGRENLCLNSDCLFEGYRLGRFHLAHRPPPMVDHTARNQFRTRTYHRWTGGRRAGIESTRFDAQQSGVHFATAVD